ncbi:MAG: Na+/H+ antiporter subunit E [Myxococcota bacterium]|nr:Na+/H+ antiporter subunit E [Myxococcota bacterium]
MSSFFVAVATGLVWMALIAETGVGTFATGAVLGLVLWRVGGARSRRPFATVRALRLSWLGLRLALYFLWELLVANAQQLRIVLAPRIDVEPGWLRFRTELETPALRALLGAMLSLTPGSVTYEETPAEDGGMMIGLHVLDLRDEVRQLEQVRRFEAPLRAMETS